MVSRALSTQQWCRFFGIYNRAGASDELGRLQRRLGDAFDVLNYVLQMLAGCPSGEVEEVLRVARTSVDEAMEEIQLLRRMLAENGPDAA